VGCIVNKATNGTIDCPCHGSEFKITNGAVVTGPAPSPVAAAGQADQGRRRPGHPALMHLLTGWPARA
jgi:Rieske Fe-S protein